MADRNSPDAASGKIKLIILIVLGMILAIALSVAGTLWFLGSGMPGSGENEAETDTFAGGFVPSIYVDIEKPLVTTVQAEGRQRYAQVYLSLEAKAPEALAAARLHLPLIRSQLITVLANSNFRDLQTPQGRQALAQRMLETVNQVLEREGLPVIERVLFRNFVVQ